MPDDVTTAVSSAMDDMSTEASPAPPSITESAGSVEGIRNELSDLDAEIDTDLLRHHLNSARSVIGGRLIARGRDRSSIPSGTLSTAVNRTAAYDLVSGDRGAFVAGKSVADASKQYAATAFIENLRNRRDEALTTVLVGNPGGTVRGGML